MAEYTIDISTDEGWRYFNERLLGSKNGEEMSITWTRKTVPPKTSKRKGVSRYDLAKGKARAKP